MIEVILLMFTLSLMFMLAYNNDNSWPYPDLMENFVHKDNYIKTCLMYPYLNECYKYYGNYDKQDNAVMNNFMTADAEFETYQWLLQFNDVKYHKNGLW